MRVPKRYAGVWLVLLILLSTLAAAQTVPPRRFARPFKGHELLQPVYPWRVPGAGGKLKLLILAHSWTTPEFAEFAKRFDFDYDLVPIWSENSLGRSYQRADSLKLWRRITGLLERNKYDCILITSYGSFPLHVWEAIYRECVASRAGLLVLNTAGAYSGMPKQLESDGFMERGECLKEIPIRAVDWTGCYDEQVSVDEKGVFTGFQTEEFPLYDKVGLPAPRSKERYVAFGEHQSGARYALFGWQKSGYVYWSIHHGVCPNQLFFPFGRVYPMADHLFAIVGKAVLWASHREPTVRFVQVTPSGTKLEPAARDILKYEVVLANDGAEGAEIVLEWEVVDESETQLAQGSRSLSIPGGERGLKVSLSQVPGTGKHLYFRARLLYMDCVADWATSHLEIAYPEDTWELTVANTTLNAPGTPFVAQIDLRETSDVDQLRVNLFDSWSRLVKRVEATPKKGVNELRVPTDDTFGVSFRLQAQKLKDGRVTGQKEQFCTLLRVPQCRYFGIRSTSSSSTVTGWYLSQLNRLYGINFYRTRGIPYFANNHFGFSFGVYSYYGRITGPISPDMEETYEKFVANDVLPVKPYAGYLYDFGDDTGVGKGLFRSSAKTKEEKAEQERKDWARFVEYLKTVYTDVGQLTANWRVKTDSFEALTRAHVAEEQKKQNLVPLLDYRQYQEWLYARHLRHMRKLLTEQMPWAKVTLNGYGNIGRNFEIVAKEVDSLVPYYRPFHLREIRGILGRDKSLGTVSGSYYGEHVDKRFLAFIPWENLLLGGNVIWLWGTGCIARDGGFSNPTYPIFESAREIASGVGELLAAADWRNDGIYILHCPRSNHAQSMGPKLGMTSSSSSTFCSALEELQVAYDFIASSQVAKGALAQRDARALFLPYSVGLEPGVQQAIRDFANAGGLVIADLRPATRTPHGRPLDKGGLDDLFGVKQKAVANPITYGRLPGTDIDTMADGSTQPIKAGVGAKVGDAPVLLTNTHGKGRTLLFNCFLGKYRTLLAAGRSDALTDWIADALSGVGLRVRPYGKLTAGTRVFRYDRGRVRYLTLYREDVPGTPERTAITLPLPSERHVYDVRNGGYLGAQSRIVREVGKQEAHVLALSKTPFPPLQVAVLTPQVQAGQAAIIQAKCGSVSPDRLLRVDVVGPDGNPYPITGRLLWAKDGETPIRWPTALSDQPGLYRLSVTDIDTGQRWTAGVRIGGLP